MATKLLPGWHRYEGTVPSSGESFRITSTSNQGASVYVDDVQPLKGNRFSFWACPAEGSGEYEIEGDSEVVNADA